MRLRGLLAYAMNGNAPWEMPWSKAKRIRENAQLIVTLGGNLKRHERQRRDAPGNMFFFRSVLRAERIIQAFVDARDLVYGAIELRLGMIRCAARSETPLALGSLAWPLITGRPPGYVEDYEAETVEVLTPHPWIGHKNALMGWENIQECADCGLRWNDPIHEATA